MLSKNIIGSLAKRVGLLRLTVDHVASLSKVLRGRVTNIDRNGCMNRRGRFILTFADQWPHSVLLPVSIVFVLPHQPIENLHQRLPKHDLAHWTALPSS